MSWEDHESKRSATAGDGAICFHFSLHNSSFILAAQRPAVAFIDRLGRRGKVFAEKNLRRKNDRERRNNHHTKGDRDQPYAAAPPKNGTAAVQAARTEKPATQNDENEEQHHGVYNPYSLGLVERQHVIKTDKYEHNDGEKETGLPRHLVAKKTRGDLHKPCIDDQTLRYENNPWDDDQSSASPGQQT